MRIIQLNAWGGKLQYQLPQFLERTSADIVCLQEIHDLKGPSGALFVTLDELKQKLKFSDAKMSPAYSFHYMNRNLEYGNAVLSKLPIISNNVIFTEGEYKKNFDVVEDSDVRNFQHVKIQHGNKALNIVNFHGPYIPGTKDGNPDTVRQIGMICDYVDKLEGAVIITGDFNLDPGSRSLSRLDSIMRNLPVEYGLTSTYSPFNNHKVVCDYIFVNESVKVLDFFSAQDLVSDHKPLILDFDL